MVQAFFSRVLPRSGNRRAFLHLGAAASEINGCWTADFSSTRDRDHRELLLFQSAHDRALLIADRRFDGGARPPGAPAIWLRRARRSRPTTTIVRLRWHNRDYRDVTDQRVVNLQRI